MFITTCVLKEKVETPNRMMDWVQAAWEIVPTHCGCAQEGSWAAKVVSCPLSCTVRNGAVAQCTASPKLHWDARRMLVPQRFLAGTAFGSTASDRTAVGDVVLDRTQLGGTGWCWVAAWRQSGQSSHLGSIGSRVVSRNLVMLELGKQCSAWAGLGRNL